MTISYRDASAADLDAICALLPRLAAFEIPDSRQPEHLWHGDRDLAIQWAKGGAEKTFVQVAETEGQLVGVAITTLKEELLSHEPSSHLEVLAIHDQFEGRGIAGQLIQLAEEGAKRRGALTMTLHP